MLTEPPAALFLYSAVRDVPASMVLQNRPTLSVPLILRSQVSVFSKVILALVPDSIIPIIPPPTIASDIEPVPPSLSTISLFKVD